MNNTSSNSMLDAKVISLSNDKSGSNKQYATQNDLLLDNLMKFYNTKNHLDRILPIINGESSLSIRVIDWFVTNYSKKYFVKYNITKSSGQTIRFNVYIDYKLKLKAYSKRRFDPFCRWERIIIPYNDNSFVQTTLAQLNFFKWALENKILDYIDSQREEIEKDMNHHNTSAKRKTQTANKESDVKEDKTNSKTRKRREELSVSAVKSIKKENVEVVVKFN